MGEEQKCLVCWRLSLRVQASCGRHLCGGVECGGTVSTVEVRAVEKMVKTTSEFIALS